MREWGRGLLFVLGGPRSLLLWRRCEAGTLSGCSLSQGKGCAGEGVSGDFPPKLMCASQISEEEEVA